MAKPGITPDSGMRKRPRRKVISMRSASFHVAGEEPPYPVYPFSRRVFVEKPNHNPFKGL